MDPDASAFPPRQSNCVQWNRVSDKLSATTGHANQMPTRARTPATDGSALHLDNQMCFALYSASLTMTKFYQPLLRKLKVTYPQYLVLLVLWEQDAQIVSELGEKLFLDSGTLTPLLKRLESVNYVRRVRDASDERRVIVSLTPAGRALRQRALTLHDRVACATQCSASDRASLTRQLGRLRSALKETLISR